VRKGACLFSEAKLRGTTHSDAPPPPPSQSKMQIEASRDTIDSTKADGWRQVTDIRSDADFAEMQRRLDEEALAKVCTMRGVWLWRLLWFLLFLVAGVSVSVSLRSVCLCVEGEFLYCLCVSDIRIRNRMSY
jgi:hypothetical protein